MALKQFRSAAHFRDLGWGVNRCNILPSVAQSRADGTVGDAVAFNVTGCCSPEVVEGPTVRDVLSGGQVGCVGYALTNVVNHAGRKLTEHWLKTLSVPK